MEALAPGRRVVAPDLLGFGASDAPDSMYRYTMLGYADLVAGLLDHLGLDRVVLGGLSMGGYVASPSSGSTPSGSAPSSWPTPEPRPTRRPSTSAGPTSRTRSPGWARRR
jgi:hypothetical protein